MISRLLRFLLILIVAQPATAFAFQDDYGDSYPKNPGIDILNYAFEIRLSDDSNSISGAARIEAQYLEKGLSELRLDLIKLSDELDGKGMTVDGVAMDGIELKYRHEDDQIYIDLGKEIRVGQRVQVVVHYHGIPAFGLKIGPNKYGDRTFFSDNWSSRARNWLPTVDHPYDKAGNELIVTAPNHYQVVSNGLLIEETDLGNGLRLTHWKNSVPLATWMYFLGAAEFAVQSVESFDGKSIQTWVYRQDRDAGFYDFAETTKKVLEYYTLLVGPYSYEKLANVQSSATGGGMEAASSIAYGENSVTGTRDRRWQNVIIHEIAHQWFGNAVTEADWNDVWLSEGFATYYTLLYRQHAYGKDDFVQGLKDARNRVINFYEDDYDFRLVRDYVEDLNDVSGGMMYVKGAWILHMLREKTGIEAYRAGVRSYYAEFRDRNARTSDFRRHIEETSGLDLKEYFDQWLFQGGIPHLEGSWYIEDGELVIEIEQVQRTYGFGLSVDFGISFEDGSFETLTVDVGADQRAQTAKSYDRVIESVSIDPSTRLLASWTFERR